MIDALDEESRAGEVSLSFRGWMLGRLLLASRQCSDVAAEAIFEKYLREVLDDVVTGRLRAGLEPEDVTASCEAWAWSYLLLHYGGEKAHEPSHWLRAARMAQAGAERLAAAASGGAGGHGDRLWASVLLTSALSAQHGCGTVACCATTPPRLARARPAAPWTSRRSQGTSWRSGRPCGSCRARTSARGRWASPAWRRCRLPFRVAVRLRPTCCAASFRAVSWRPWRSRPIRVTRRWGLPIGSTPPSWLCGARAVTPSVPCE